jgi:hypothetical protein
MKKVIKLTESDLIKIVKRVIKEQTEQGTVTTTTTMGGPVVPKNSVLKVDDDVINHFRKFKVDFKKEETPEDFLGKLNKSNVGINAFHITSEGWKFPIQPVFVNIPLENSNIRLSFEPFNKERGVYMFRVTKSF